MRIWGNAKDLAAKTPESRNRYVDFLRAASILVVVIGHWLIATVYYQDGTLEPGHLLEITTDLHWMTWAFQVMPIFFIVGGFSNSITLQSAEKKGQPYATWLAARLNRLVAPLLFLLIGWGAIALGQYLLGVSAEVIQYTSRASLIPTWFLAIYIMVVVLAPVTFSLWRKFGFASFWGFVALAAITDWLFFAGFEWVGWSNYFWVWLGVHQLGYAWREGRLGGPVMLLGYAFVAFIALYLLINFGPYPMAMVGSPGEDVSNSLPPKITLLVLGVVQLGLLLSLEGPMRRALDGLRLWTATVLINSMIMTLYLWHITLMIAVTSALFYAGGFFLGIDPGSAEWWWSRIPWVVGLLVLLMPGAFLLAAFERRPFDPNASMPHAARQIVGAVMISLGIAIVAMYGFAGTPIKGMDIAAFAFVIVGAAISGLLFQRKAVAIEEAA
ncbi:MAG: acyltransferase [Woeseiaceae bacterium]|nr:acyltransferase [Woeseiaceae bacterium]